MRAHALVLLLLCCLTHAEEAGIAIQDGSGQLLKLDLLAAPPGAEPGLDRARFAHDAMAVWLRRYYRQQRAAARSKQGWQARWTGGDDAERHDKGRYVTAEQMQELEAREEEQRRLRGAQRPHFRPCRWDQSREAPSKRDNLVVAPVGDKFRAARWAGRPELCNFDLILIYYGSSNFTCQDRCKKVFRAAGPKWKLIYALYSMPEWAELSKGYKAIMVADDDLRMTACTINRAFEVFHEYNLLLAQPSLCSSPLVYTFWKILYQNPLYVLRYTTFIEIMAPMFRMDMFNGLVGPSLHNAYYGWGLDHVWPFLLRYPLRQIAVIDDVCMWHPTHRANKQGSLYDVEAPYDQYKEHQLREAEYGYTPDASEKLGLPHHAVQVIGGVLSPGPPPHGSPNSSPIGRLDPSQHPDVVLGQAVVALAAVVVLAAVVMLLLWRRRRRRRARPANAGGARGRLPERQGELPPNPGRQLLVLCK